MSTTRLFYARALLVAGGCWVEPEREQVLVAVMTGEDSTAWWNPLDTTLDAPGATPYNSFGPNGSYHVWNYPNAKEGVSATLRTFEQQNMSRFWTPMRSRTSYSAIQLARFFSLTPWGGVGDVLPLEIVQDYNEKRRSYQVDRSHIVTGPGSWPYQSNGSPVG